MILKLKFRLRDKRASGLNILLMIALAGCAITNTGVVSTGPDTYLIASDASGAEVTAGLYREANAFCAEQKKQLITINVTALNRIPFVRNASSKLEFRCVAPSDPVLNRNPT